MFSPSSSQSPSHSRIVVSDADKWLQLAHKIEETMNVSDPLKKEADKIIISEITSDLRGLLVGLHETDWMFNKSLFRPR